MKTTIAFIVVLVALVAASFAAACDSEYTGPFFTCTNGEVTKVHQGQWHAAQLESQGWTCVLNCPDANGRQNHPCPTVVTVSESSSPMIRADGDNTVTMVPDAEILSASAGARSLVNGWKPAYAHIGFTEGGTNIGTYTFNGTSGTSTGKWTDDSGSTYNEPNTLYSNPVVA